MTAEQSNTISIGKAVCIILMLIGHAGPNEYVYNLGKSSEIGAKYIISSLQKKITMRNKRFLSPLRLPLKKSRKKALNALFLRRIMLKNCCAFTALFP